MSELKAYKMVNELYCTDRPSVIPAEVYFKSEADKVIAELKSDIADLRDDKKLTDAILDERNAEIVELKKACNDKDDWCLHTLKENRHQKYKRCLLYAKNHKNLGDLATDTIRLIGLNAYAFTKETETACVAYWNRIGDCHRRHHDEWLKLAEKFKPNKSTAQ